MNTSIKRISAVAAIAGVVLVAVWYLALFGPQSRNLSAAHKAHAAAEQKVSQLRNQVVQLDALKAQIPADKAALSVLQAAVPDNPQLDDALRQLHAVATGSGVSLASVSPSTPTANSSTSSSSTSSSSSSSSSQQASTTPSITLTMTGSGSYAQLMSFLSGLDSMPRTVVVTSVELAGGSNDVTGQFTANIFYTGA